MNDLGLEAVRRQFDAIPSTVWSGVSVCEVRRCRGGSDGTIELGVSVQIPAPHCVIWTVPEWIVRQILENSDGPYDYGFDDWIVDQVELLPEFGLSPVVRGLAGRVSAALGDSLDHIVIAPNDPDADGMARERPDGTDVWSKVHPPDGGRWQNLAVFGAKVAALSTADKVYVVDAETGRLDVDDDLGARRHKLFLV